MKCPSLVGGGTAVSLPSSKALDYPPSSTTSAQAPPGSAHLVQALAAQVAHGLLNALWQWLARALHMDERWHPKYMLSPVVWGLVPFHELWN